MTQTTQTMNVQPRKLGKGASIAYREERQVPAVIYGPKTKNVNCLIEEIFVVKHSGSRHESSIFQTQSEKKDLTGLKVMLKSIDTHPVSGRPIHVDLYALDMTAKIKVNVNIEFEGEPAGAEAGGVLQVILRDIEIECNPVDIPESIKVDVSGMDLNDSLHVSEVAFPAGIEPITAPERTICTVHIPKEEPEEEPEEVAAEGAEGAEGGEAKAEGAEGGDKKEAAPAGDKKQDS